MLRNVSWKLKCKESESPEGIWCGLDSGTCDERINTVFFFFVKDEFLDNFELLSLSATLR